MTTITIEELRRLAAAGAVSLPDSHAERGASIDTGSEPKRADRAAQVAELLKTVRDLTKDRSPEQTAELERWLEERDA
jgi:hypothetical protein